MFVFDIQHWIDLVWLEEKAKPILKAKAGVKTAFVPGVLPIEVEFCSPPFSHSVLEFSESPGERVNAWIPSYHDIRSNFQLIHLLQVVIVGNEVRRRRFVLSIEG